MIMTVKYYNLLVNTGNGWQPFDEGQFTEKEANKELRHLRKARPDLKLRKKCVFNGEVERWYAK